jgi:flagellar biosynthesis/type III secretory pathway protein FliH
VSNGFVPLDLFLRSTCADPDVPPEPPPARAEEQQLRDCAEAVRAARLFRAGLHDALEAALPELLRRIARDVLARELRLAPAELRKIVETALESCAGEPALSVRAHPGDLDALASLDLQRVGDDALQPGDVYLALRSGTIDLRLSTRLNTMLDAWA